MKKPQWQSELEYLADCEADGKEWGVIDNGRVAAYLMREGYAIRLPQYRNIKAYQITGTGARAIGRGSLFPMYDVYEGYRENVWRGGYTALSYEEWYSIQSEAQQDAQPAPGKVGSDADLLDEDVYIDEPVNSKPIAVISLDSDVPVSPRLNNALNILTGENRQWVHVPLEKQHTGIYALLDEAGVRDGGLMSLSDRVKALIQERDKLLRSEDKYHQENERLRVALRKIANGNHAGFISHIRSIAKNALAEPVGD